MRRLRGDADISTAPDLDNANEGNDTRYFVEKRAFAVRFFFRALWQHCKKACAVLSDRKENFNATKPNDLSAVRGDCTGGRSGGMS